MQTPTTRTSTTLDNVQSSSSQSLQCSSENGTIILATAIVYIQNKHGQDQMVRALLDSGSQINFISEEAVQRLQLKRERDTVQVSGIGEKPTTVKNKVSISIKSRDNNYEFSTDLWVIKSVANQQPEKNITIQGWNIPPNLELADPFFYKKQKIDLLLGAETFFDLLSVGQIKLHNTLPTLQKTLLGWIVSGRYAPIKTTQICNLVEEIEDSTSCDIDKTLRKFWEIEEVSPSRSILTAEQIMCEEKFAQTTKILDKRFEVHLPLKTDPQNLGMSLDTASRRFYALERRLNKTPVIREMYNDFMKEYLELRHMEPIENVPNTPHFFIPHQCVLRMQSTSTKLRVVFDASARTSTQTSLNDILMVGPTIQPDLYTILLRFRLYNVLSAFVGNRVSEIQEWCSSISWRHVPTKENPADLTSRGSTVQHLNENDLWFNGPKFLKRPKSEWPVNPKFETPLTNESLELRKSKLCLSMLVEENVIVKIVEEKSSYITIIKIVAYIYRFIHNAKSSTTIKNQSLVLSPKELNWAVLKIISTIQRMEFKEEIKNLENEKILKPNLQKLNPFIQIYEEQEFKLRLLRVGGRLVKAPVPFDAKFPLLLTKSSSFVIKYVRHWHTSHCHAGVQALVGLMRQLIWVINARQLARKVVRNCIHCFRYKPKLTAQIMGNLPEHRLQSLRPFYICGVDFCGPFQTSHRIRGRQPYKTYASIFVCFATKAIHIELVSELSTNAFIIVLKRFIARRGLPQKIYCDNATNFVGASSKLKVFRDFFLQTNTQELLQGYSSQRGVEFVFIPPRSPHFGGLWEASVKSTKNLLYKTVGNVHLTYEELLTVLYEIEAILNSRPISALTEDPNDGDALSPAHWLVGSSLHALPDGAPPKHTQNLSSLHRWQLIAALKLQFWSKFQRDYILSLQCRNKWSQVHAKLEVGALVVIHEDNTPPQQWKLGRVVATMPGSDGRVRVVDVKTNSGIYRRAVHKLAILPVY